MIDELREVPGSGEYYCVSVAGGRTWLICHSLQVTQGLKVAAEAAERSFSGSIPHRFKTQAKADEYVRKRWKNLPYHTFPALPDKKARGTGEPK